eukprot:COSAG01_NODE_10467_length_2158_cov_53.207382_1_plen_92_part_00
MAGVGIRWNMVPTPLPFGGKVMVFAGDRRQIPPVIPGAEPREVVRSVISASASIWSVCDVTELVHPVRDAEDPAYSAFVMRKLPHSVLSVP